MVPQEVGHGALSPAHEYGIGGAVDMLVPGSRSLSRMWEGAILAVFVMSREWQESTSQGETRGRARGQCLVLECSLIQTRQKRERAEVWHQRRACPKQGAGLGEQSLSGVQAAA